MDHGNDNRKTPFIFRLVDELLPKDETEDVGIQPLGLRQFLLWLIGLGIVVIVLGVLIRMAIS